MSDGLQELLPPTVCVVETWEHELGGHQWRMVTVRGENGHVLSKSFDSQKVGNLSAAMRDWFSGPQFKARCAEFGWSA